MSLGILTTWSRAVNLSYVLILISFLLYSKISFKKYINPLSSVIIFILVFDVFVMALFFGNAKIIERLVGTSVANEGIRLDLHVFGWEQFKNFWLFGYGNEAFGQIFKSFYIMPEKTVTSFLAENAHNDGIELLGEVGVLGISILFLLYIQYFKKILMNINKEKQLARLILFSLLILTLFIQSLVDYSLHTPGILILLMTILSIGLIDFGTDSH